MRGMRTGKGCGGGFCAALGWSSTEQVRCSPHTAWAQVSQARPPPPPLSPALQAAGRRLSYYALSHVLGLDLQFHLNRRTGWGAL